jgi:hypothetical protein
VKLTERELSLRAMREASFERPPRSTKSPPISATPAISATRVSATPANVNTGKRGRPPGSAYRTPEGRFDRRAYQRDKARERRAKAAGAMAVT